MNRNIRLQKRDRALLVFYATRQIASLAILTWVLLSALELPDKRLAWAASVGMFVFAGWVSWVLTRSVRRYRSRYSRESQSQ